MLPIIPSPTLRTYQSSMPFPGQNTPLTAPGGHDTMAIRFAGKEKGQKGFELTQKFGAGPDRPRAKQLPSAFKLVQSPDITIDRLTRLIKLEGAHALSKPKKTTKETPLHFLLKNEALTPELLQVAIKATGGSQSLFLKSKLGQTPLHALMTNEALTPELLQTALDSFKPNDSLHVRDTDHKTPMHMLMANRALTADLLDMVLNANVLADLESTDKNGDTPLHMLMANRALTTDLLRIAIDAAGIEPLTEENHAGKTPLQVLMKNRALSSEMIDLIRANKVLASATKPVKDALLKECLPFADDYPFLILDLLRQGATFPFERRLPSPHPNTPVGNRLFQQTTTANGSTLVMNPYFIKRFGKERADQIVGTLLAAEIEQDMATVRIYENTKHALGQGTLNTDFKSHVELLKTNPKTPAVLDAEHDLAQSVIEQIFSS